jgi:DNA-binding NarL/FixJ family response regulator
MIRIIIIDTQDDYVKVLCENLSKQKDFEVVGTGKDSYEAVKLVDTHKPDIVLMDINFPLGDEVNTAALIKYRSPQTSIIINWDGREQQTLSVLFNSVSGYITKQANSDLLCHAIRAVYYGGSLIAPGNILKIQGDPSSAQSGKIHKFSDFVLEPVMIESSDTTIKLPETISSSELQIMGFVGKGYTYKEIAKKLQLSEGTIRNYVSSVLQKTGLKDRTQVAIYAVKAGL